jgi:hypothetical protein
MCLEIETHVSWDSGYRYSENKLKEGAVEGCAVKLSRQERSSDLGFRV